MELLDIWTQAVDGIRAQGGYALDPKHRCRLLDTNTGNRCAVGQFIPPDTTISPEDEDLAGTGDFESYEHFMDESPIPALLPFTITPEVYELLIRLQDWHDTSAQLKLPLEEALLNAEGFKPHG